MTVWLTFPLVIAVVFWFVHVSPSAVRMALWSQEPVCGPDPIKWWGEHRTDRFLDTHIPTQIFCKTEISSESTLTVHIYPEKNDSVCVSVRSYWLFLLRVSLFEFLCLCLPLVLTLTALWGFRSIPAVSNRAVDSTSTSLRTWENITNEQKIIRQSADSSIIGPLV